VALPGNCWVVAYAAATRGIGRSARVLSGNSTAVRWQSRDRTNRVRRGRPGTRCGSLARQARSRRRSAAARRAGDSHGFRSFRVPRLDREGPRRDRPPACARCGPGPAPERRAAAASADLRPRAPAGGADRRAAAVRRFRRQPHAPARGARGARRRWPGHHQSVPRRAGRGRGPDLPGANRMPTARRHARCGHGRRWSSPCRQRPASGRAVRRAQSNSRPREGVPSTARSGAWRTATPRRPGGHARPAATRGPRVVSRPHEARWAGAGDVALRRFGANAGGLRPTSLGRCEAGSAARGRDQAERRPAAAWFVSSLRRRSTPT
jgi:hypothetical protein